MKELVLVGFGGHGKSVADCIERQGKYQIVGYTDLKPLDGCKYNYLGTDEALDTLYHKGIRNAVVCIGYLGKGNVREILYEKLKSIGYTLPIIIDPSALISETAEIGEGTFVGKMAVINAEANVGKMAIINTKALVEHECIVGDFTHIAVGATLCGAVTVGESCLVGASATVLQTLTVGDHTVIGAGSLIVKSTENDCIVKNRIMIDERMKI